MELMVYTLAKLLGANLIAILAVVLAIGVSKNSKIAAYIVLLLAGGLYVASFIGSVELNDVDTFGTIVTAVIFLIGIIGIHIPKKKEPASVEDAN